MIIGCWNIAWARPDSQTGRQMVATLLSYEPEVICIAEGHADTLHEGWHGITSDADYGYGNKPARRKVALWSLQPWHHVDTVGSADLPPGRLVSGQTQTSLGPIRVIGICVPWFAAHVKGGRGDAKNWEEHNAYLQGLRGILSAVGDDMPTVLIGDLNQHIPRKRAPRLSHDLLLEALGPRFSIWTAGQIQDLDRQVVCHIGGNAALTCNGVAGLSRAVGEHQLSDHDGLIAQIARCDR